MKQITTFICIGSLALAFTASGARDNPKSEVRAKKAQRASAVQAAKPSNSGRAIARTGRAQAQRSDTTARFRQRASNSSPRIKSNAIVRQKSLRSDRVRASQDLSARSSKIRARNDLAVSRARNVDRQRNVTVNRERNFRGRNFDGAREENRTINRTLNRERNVSIVNNWRGERFSGQRYSAFRNYRRSWHHRDWWHSHHPRIVLVLGGAYFWNSGYWYPAWGYDPGYHYPYDGPIYGYGDLTPDQVIVNVQVQLQRDGYYAGPIDGLLGPETRQGLAAFQADRGLAITSAIDEPTLASLGLV